MFQVLIMCTGRGQDYGEGSRADKAAYHQVLPDEDTSTGCFIEAADFEVQPGNGRCYEGRHKCKLWAMFWLFWQGDAGADVRLRTQAMMSMNAQMNLPQLQQIMRQFEMQSEQLEQKQEMMEDAMDSALDEGDEDEEADELVQSVFDEIGIDMRDDLADAPLGAVGAPEPEAAATDDLEARLAALRGGA